MLELDTSVLRRKGQNTPPAPTCYNPYLVPPPSDEHCTFAIMIPGFTIRGRQHLDVFARTESSGIQQNKNIKALVERAARLGKRVSAL